MMGRGTSQTSWTRTQGNLTSMMVDAWVGLARDGSKALKVDFTKNDENRIKMWLSRWSFGEDGDASKDETSSKKKPMEPPSKLCLEDMAAQGASKPGDLAFLELTLALAPVNCGAAQPRISPGTPPRGQFVRGWAVTAPR